MTPVALPRAPRGGGRTAMKELLEPVLKQLPSYVPDLARLVTRPKTSIARWIAEEQAALARPVIFVALSVAIGFLLQLPRVDKDQSLTTMVAAMAGFKIVALIVFAAVVHGLFRLSGGQAKFVATLSAYLYSVSPLYIVLVLFDLASLGTLRGHADPAFAAALRTDPFMNEHPALWKAFEAARPDLARTYVAIGVARLGVILAWFVACWGAFRALHGVSRWRSSLIGVAAPIAFYLFMQGMGLVMRGMFGTQLPAIQ